jgi:hypothetical protein
LSKKLSFSRLLVGLAHFDGSELPVDLFSIVKKYFFTNTNNIKDLNEDLVAKKNINTSPNAAV